MNEMEIRPSFLLQSEIDKAWRLDATCHDDGTYHYP
jgi:hypothetical protein